MSEDLVEGLVTKEFVKNSEAPCRVCGRSQEERPLCFRSEPYCCDNCRKALLLEATAEARGDLAALEAERPPHDFTPTSDSPHAVCAICHRAPEAGGPHSSWFYYRGGVGWKDSAEMEGTRRPRTTQDWSRETKEAVRRAAEGLMHPDSAASQASRDGYSGEA